MREKGNLAIKNHAIQIYRSNQRYLFVKVTMEMDLNGAKSRTHLCRQPLRFGIKDQLLLVIVAALKDQRHDGELMEMDLNGAKIWYKG